MSWADAIAAVVLCAFVTHLGRVLLRAPIAFSPFGDRDLVRARSDTLAHLGAELNGHEGTRTPGRLLHDVYALALELSPGAHVVYEIQVVLLLASVVALHLSVRRRFGPLAGLVAAATWATSTHLQFVVGSVWNPALLPVFVVGAVEGILRVVVDRDGLGLAVVAACVALGAQVHPAIAVLLVAVLPSARAPRPRRLVWGLLLGVVAVALIELPYVVGEVATGWRNTLELLPRGEVEAVPNSSWISRVASILRALVDLRVVDPFSEAPPAELVVRAALPFTGLAGAALAIGSKGSTSRPPAPTRALADLGLGLALAIGALAVSVSTLRLTARYVVPLTGLGSVLVGIVVGEVARVVTSRSRVAALALLALVTGVTASRLPEPVDGNWPLPYGPLLVVLAEVRRETGWTLADLAGRASWAQWDSRTGEPRLSYEPIEHLLAIRGERFGGSRPPPCALLLSGRPVEADGAPWPSARVVDTVLPHRAPLVGTPEVVPLSYGWFLFLYTRADDRCPTTTTQRWVQSPLEDELRALAPTMEPGRPHVWSSTPGEARVAVAVTPTFVLAVELETADGELRVRLTSPQLRGTAELPGWFVTATVLRPRVVLTPAIGEPVELVLHPDLVGPHTALAPLERRFPSPPPGAYDVALAFERVPWRAGAPLPPDVSSARPWSATLLQGWDVGGAPAP